jgi:hypothetical protein
MSVNLNIFLFEFEHLGIGYQLELIYLNKINSKWMKTSSGGEEPNANNKSSLFVRILERCRSGATRKDLIDTIPLLSNSRLQLRRSTAELVDRRLLSYDEKRHAYVTTDKGILFLNELRKPQRSPDIN